MTGSGGGPLDLGAIQRDGLAHRIHGGHWMKFDADRRVAGCHCGFRCDVEQDSGFGDSYLDHFEGVVRSEIADELAVARAENERLNRILFHGNGRKLANERDAAMADAARYREAVEQVRALHRPVDVHILGLRCRWCTDSEGVRFAWPCPTARALDVPPRDPDGADQ